MNLDEKIVFNHSDLTVLKRTNISTGTTGCKFYAYKSVVVS